MNPEDTRLGLLGKLIESIDENFEGKPKVSGAEIFRKAAVDLKQPAKRPPLAISIGTDTEAYKGEFYPLPFASFGGISLVKGEEKTRKSFAMSLILAAAIGGKANNYAEEIRGHNLTDKWIIAIDTEQDDYYSWLNADRVRKMVGEIPKNFKYIRLRGYSIDQRNEFLDWLFLESPIKNSLGIVSLDGYVDFVKNFNDQEQSSEFTQRLLRYTEESKCHITGVLHLNPGSEKARGHLGTILQQKCESVVIIEDMGTYSTFKCQRGRGKGFKNFDFKVNSDWLPEVIEGKCLPKTSNL